MVATLCCLRLRLVFFSFFFFWVPLCSTDNFSTIYFDGHHVFPRTDYYVALLHSRLMGPRVLNASCDDSSILVYAHCARTGGGLAVMYTNPSNSSVSISVAGAQSGQQVLAYVLSAPGGDLTSQNILLNGAMLNVSVIGEPPAMPPQVSTLPFAVPAFTYGFLILPDSKLEQCQ